MSNHECFSHDEIPFETLEKFGLTSEMIEDLPQNVMQRFLSSQPTPALPLTYENIEGQKLVTPTRLTLVRLSDGMVDVCLSPRWTDKDLSEFTPEQQAKLENGEVIVAEMGNNGKCFIQFDDSINKVIGSPVALVNKNISLLARSYGLDDTDMETLENGGVIEINVNGNILSAGIDLNDDACIRTANGPIATWKQDKEADRLPKYSFGLFGCWMADDNNNLSYVPEENYDEEMVREFERTAEANAADANLQQLKV